MMDQQDIAVTLPADLNQVDETGHVWAFGDGAAEPDRVRPGALIVAGDPLEPCLALVVDLAPGPDGREIVHLDVLGHPDQLIDELRHARLIPSTPHRDA